MNYAGLTYADESYADVESTAVWEADKLGQLLDDPQAERVYLLEATVYDRSAGATTTLRYASDEFHTKPTDTPANTSYVPRLVQPFNFEARLFSGQGVLASGSASFGAIRLVNTDGGLDSDALDHNWDGREVVIKAGTRDFTFSEFEIIFTGRVNNLSWDERDLVLNLRDPRTQLDKPVQETLYAGTGGDEGDSSLKGRPKPQTYGHAREVKAVLIDSTNLIYQVHDGSVREIEAVYDAGTALTDEGDVSDLRSAAAPSAGAFKTDETDGLFRLGATPDGTITADVKGDDGGPDGYVTTAAGIFERLVTRKSDLTSSDVDGATVNETAARNDSVVGLFIPDQSQPMQQTLTSLMASVGGWWTFGRDGRVQVGILGQPGTSVLTLGDEDVMPYGSLRRTSPGRVVYRVRLGYDRTWTVQPEGQLAASLSAEEKSLRAEPFRYVTAEDATTQTEHAFAEVLERETTIDVEVDAQAEADRLLALLGTRRDLYTVPVGWRLFKFNLGETVTLDVTQDGASRFDLPKDFVIVGIVENVRRREAVLTLWG